ncbi:hypothetical protein R9208_00005, partial [Flammeovirgaceae bacterium SG7u.132]|nr:hypothetical protein [Flammeovirgaceae bacterium SG7u.132]
AHHAGAPEGRPPFFCPCQTAPQAGNAPPTQKKIQRKDGSQLLLPTVNKAFQPEIRGRGQYI